MQVEVFLAKVFNNINDEDEDILYDPRSRQEFELTLT